MPPDLPLPSKYRWWSWATIVSGVLWIFFSAAPTFITTLMGVPFALYAIFGGWYLRRLSRQASDNPSAWRATWGMGLGCLGCAWQVVVLIIFTTLGISLVATGIGEGLKYIQGTPTP